MRFIRSSALTRTPVTLLVTPWLSTAMTATGSSPALRLWAGSNCTRSHWPGTASPPTSTRSTDSENSLRGFARLSAIYGGTYMLVHCNDLHHRGDRQPGGRDTARTESA